MQFFLLSEPDLVLSLSPSLQILTTVEDFAPLTVSGYRGEAYGQGFTILWGWSPGYGARRAYK
jgi:hypothetical protein